MREAFAAHAPNDYAQPRVRHWQTHKHGHGRDELREFVTAPMPTDLPLESVAQAIGLHEVRLCRVCLTGKYPTAEGERLYQLAVINRYANQNDRTYEVATPELAACGGEMEYMVSVRLV